MKPESLPAGRDTIRLVILTVVVLLFMLLAVDDQATAQQEEIAPNIGLLQMSDGLVVDAIFAKQQLYDSGVGVCDRAKAKGMQQGFNILADWVLPNDRHRDFRVTADFVAGNATATDSRDTNRQSQIISPAIDLIELANRLGQSKALEELIRRCVVDSPSDQCDQTALLALIAINCGELDRAGKLLEDLFERVRADKQVLDESRQAVLLCVDRASESIELSLLSREPVETIIQLYIEEVERTPWHRHFWAAHAKILEQNTPRDLDRLGEGDYPVQWYPVSRTTAFEHGSAFPAARWSVMAGMTRNLSSKGDDFLFFMSPLRGDFDVETDVTGFGFRDSQLMISGNWVGPIYDHQHYSIGNVRGEIERFKLDPPMSDTHSQGFIHYRTRVRDGVASTFFNGRKIHDHRLNPNADPWLAIRSSYRHDGGVDDLRITGTPMIPETIAMVDSPQLLGWYDYFQSPSSNPSELTLWKAKVVAGQSGDDTFAEVFSPHEEELSPGSFAERLLVYTRPILEDGTIEYEFWFDAGKTIAHPAIGRDCFLLESDGVALHQVTDGRFERTNLRPDNRTPTQSEQSSASNLPLLAQTWNQMRLEFKGDVLTLILNGEVIHETAFEKEQEQRNFGLFHFADQSNLRVRDLRWSGEWPKQLPGLSDQTLAIYANQFLDRSAAELKEVFTHRFDEHSIVSRKFIVVDGDPLTNIQATSEGVVLDREGVEGYRAAMLSPVVQVGGNFDVTLSFDQLALVSAPDKVASIRMNVIAANDSNDFASVIRAQDRGNKQIVQCLKMQTIEGSERRHYFASQPMEAIAGRLRFSRREDKIYYLIAENDSTQFRLVGQEDFTSDDLRDAGIQFGSQIQGVDGRAQARFTAFELRANRLGGLAIEDQDKLIAKLNEQRDQLPVSFTHDFSAATPADTDFYRWTDLRPWDPNSGGLVIDAPGSDDWTSAGLSVRRQFEGDFDISFYFDQPRLATPTQGGRSQVYLQLELDDEDKTQLSAMLNQPDMGEMYSQAQMRTKADGSYRYQNIGSLAINKPDHFRVLRRGTETYFFVGTQSDEQELMVGSAKTSARPIRYFGVRMLLHTGGADRSSQVTIKSISVNAEREIGSIVVPNIQDQLSQPKTLFDSFRDLFR